MPNWCCNELKISHTDPAMMARFQAAFKEGRTLDEFIPVPQALKDTIAGSVPQGYERELHEFTQALNRKYYGHANWYDYCVDEWGTKWDIGGENADIFEKDGALVASFESAWSPPVAAYEKLMALGFEIEAYYYEPGCSFVGMFTEGDDCCYNLPETWTDAKRLLPYALIEIFNLEEHYSMDEEHEIEVMADQMVAEEREREAFAKNS
jgi:hypothetical protein